MLYYIALIVALVCCSLSMDWAYRKFAFRYASRWKAAAIGFAISSAPVLVLFATMAFLPDDILRSRIVPGPELKPGYSVLHLVGMTSTIFGFNRAYAGLRQETPARRIAIGCAMMVFSVAVFVAIGESLGHRRLFENTLLHDVTLLLGIWIFVFAFILSLALILAGIVQAIKRWRYYRRQAREVTIAGL
jgi:hypothetical protein